MKHYNFLISPLLAGLLLSVGQAQASNWILGGSIDYVIGDTDANAINRQLSDLGFETELVSNIMLSANLAHYRIEGEPISILGFGVMYQFD